MDRARVNVLGNGAVMAKESPHYGLFSALIASQGTLTDLENPQVARYITYMRVHHGVVGQALQAEMEKNLRLTRSAISGSTFTVLCERKENVYAVLDGHHRLCLSAALGHQNIKASIVLTRWRQSPALLLNCRY
jgi:hypothetical protein